MIIAVDFDGTIVEHRYPHIGKEIPFAIATLKRLQAEHHLLILWSVREGNLLEEAVSFCRERGLEFYAVNANHPDEEADCNAPQSCRKLRADVFIDDRNVGGLPDWGAIYEMINRKINNRRYYREMYQDNLEEKPSFWKRLFGGNNKMFWLFNND